MEFMHDLTINNGFAIPCNDEPDFRRIARDNGQYAEEFTNSTSDGWEGLYIELENGYIVYFYGSDSAYILLGD